MKLKTLKTLLVAAGLVGAINVALATAPLDFNYRVTGANSVRPTLVFNDGRDIFIEIADNADVRVVGAKSTRQGPYLVVMGMPREFALVNGAQERANIRHDVREPEPAVQPESAEATMAAAFEANEPPKPRVPQVRSEDLLAQSQAAPSAYSRNHEAPAPVRDIDLQAKKIRFAALASPGAKTLPVSGAPSSAAHASSAPAATACAQAGSSESVSLIAVGFASGARTLSDAAAQEVAQLASRSGVNEIHAVIPSDWSGAIVHHREDHLRDIFRNAGIEASQMRFTRGRTFGGLVEIEGVSGAAGSCHLPIARTAESGSARAGDVLEVLAEVAREMGVSFRVEGEPQPIAVRVQGEQAEHTEMLRDIGNQISGKATVVLRDHELVMRFN